MIVRVELKPINNDNNLLNGIILSRLHYEQTAVMRMNSRLLTLVRLENLTTIWILFANYIIDLENR